MMTPSVTVILFVVSAVLTQAKAPGADLNSPPKTQAPMPNGARNATSMIGKVRVTTPAYHPRVFILAGNQIVEILGELKGEIARLQSIEIEVIGDMQPGKRMHVRTYRILDIGGGYAPIVGQLIRVGDGFALRDGDGAPIRLSVGVRTHRRLSDHLGSKLWVFGHTLLSGELKVVRYGVLREPSQASKPASSEGAPSHATKSTAVSLP